MLYRTEEGELKGGLSLFNTFFSSYAATRPLLRQIENLQNSYGNHTQTWERVERNLTDRLSKWKPNCIQNILKGYILYALFSSILQYPQFCKQTALLGSTSYLATVSQGGDLAC